MYRLAPNHRGKILRIARKVLAIVYKNKRVSIYELSLELGYSPHYFRYAILPAVLAYSKGCLEREGDSVVWNEKCKPEVVE